MDDPPGDEVLTVERRLTHYLDEDVHDWGQTAGEGLMETAKCEMILFFFF